MSDLDDAIRRALTQEDKDFLAQFDKEPNPLSQVVGVYRGPMAWIYIAFTVVAVILGPIGLYCVYQFFIATELRPLLYWGFGVSFILVLLSVVRLVFFMQINTNSVLRELKRLELQVARLAAQSGKGV